MNYDSIQIGFFMDMWKKTGVNVSFQRLLNDIKSGKWKASIAQLRSLPKDSPERANAKRGLPVCMLSGSTRGGHKAVDVLQHSGFLQIDIDHVPDPESVRDRIGEDRHIFAAWISPSGDGVKAVIRVPADTGQHKNSAAATVDYMHETYALKIDRACSDVGRLCFVSFDSDLVTNPDAVELRISKEVLPGVVDDYSSMSLRTTSYVLGNKAFRDFESLAPLYQRLVTRRYGRPQRGERNASMVEIVASCFCAVAPEFVLSFVSEFYNQHADIFADYDFQQWQKETRAVLDGCRQSYPSRLTESEQAAYSALGDEQSRSAFRICQSLSKCGSDSSVPPPLFHLSCQQLCTRLGILKMQAWRILKSFEDSGFIETVSKGTVRKKDVKGVATVFRWLLAK